MNQPDDELRRLLNEAVDDVHPHEGLTTIKSKTKEKKMSARGPVLFGAGGAAIATAAVIGVIAWTGGFGSDDPKDAEPAGSPTQSSTANDPTPTEVEPTEAESPAQPADPEGSAVAIYFVGDGPQGPVLFREFQRLTEPEHGLANHLGALMASPLDPDYRTVWQPGHLTEAAFDDEIIRVTVGNDALRERPDGMSKAEAEASIQQVVYTLQGAVGERAPVQFVLDGNPVDQVFGVPTAEPLAAASALDTLSLMSVTSPAEGQTVSGTFTATGVSNGPEANVQWQVLKDGNEVASGFGTAEGWMDDKLFPWEVEVDVTDLEPGEYVLRFHNEDPSGGVEGNGPAEDTRTIIVE